MQSSSEVRVRATNTEQLLKRGARNINMITYGGQASVQIANAIMAVQDDIDFIEVACIGRLVWQDSTTLEDGFRRTIEAMP